MEAIMAGKEISVKTYVVRLSGEERQQLETLIRKGKPIYADIKDTDIAKGDTRRNERVGLDPVAPCST